MEIFNLAFTISAVLTALATLSARAGSESSAPTTAAFRGFQLTFLVIYYVSMTADWLQGPYVYALYSSYGFSKHDIAVLFVGGFGASMVFGTFIGAAADRLGRKRFCQLYCVLYIASCVTKHAKDYNMLMVGRVLGGVATSLLFSSFDSWLVCEHNARGYESKLLSGTFSWMYFGNSLCAILAGMMAEAAADRVPLTATSSPPWYYGGYCSPFDLSAMFLVVALALITVFWNENYGERSARQLEASRAGYLESASASLHAPIKMMMDDPSIVLCGTVVSLFEGSMYIFVFNWTPSISAGMSTTPPFGWIFACFMVACMGGSSLFALLSQSLSCEKILLYTFLVAAAALSVPIFATSTAYVLTAFLVFEACVGIYWPAMGTVKSKVVPEAARATIYNIFRIPLNAVVLGVLLNQMDVSMAFFWCTLMLAVSFGCMLLLGARSQKQPSSTIEDGEQALINHAEDDGK